MMFGTEHCRIILGPQKRAPFLQDGAGAWPEAERITLVMDNLDTHSAASL